MFAINDLKMYYDIADGQAIVINFQTGMYYGMSSLGSAVLDQLLKGVSPEALAAALEQVEGCPQDIAAAIGAFIASLEEKDILIKTPFETPDAPKPAFAATAFEDGFSLSVDEFAEAQDLILADPIHDVDVDMGWPILKD